jgi:hypothetical protein
MSSEHIVDLNAIEQRLQVDANCKGIDTQEFYAGYGESLAGARILCGRCVVVDECLTVEQVQLGPNADRNEFHGFRAGLSPEERFKILKRQRAEEDPRKIQKDIKRLRQRGYKQGLSVLQGREGVVSIRKYDSFGEIAS